MSDNTKVKRASGQRPKKRRSHQFYGNQYTEQSEVSGENFSASAKKLSTGGVLQNDEKSTGNFQGYLLMDKGLLFSALEECLCCFICHNKVTMFAENDYGLVVNLSVSCSVCGVISSFRNSMMLGENQKASDLNRRFTFAMRCIGKGLDASKTFCGVMDLPSPVSQKSYDKIISHIHAATHTVTKASMKQAVEEEVNLTGSSDLTVSGDGTWKTRGHSSRVGVTTVIGSETGKVIDRYVSSSYCKGCEAAKNIPTENLLLWKSEHHEVCSKNHSGSAAQMEVNGMIEMFSRSEEEYGVRYVNYIGDGDCKTFAGITNNNSYNVPVSKIECVGHVQKRMGARLRKLKTEYKGKKLSDNKPLSGKGRLTDALIDKLTTYYGNAIRKHSDNVKDMQKAIWAIWYHKASNDDTIMHDFCPDGVDSWCPYRKAVANAALKDFKHKNPVPLTVMECIKPVFKDLSHPDLLRKCLGGKTQNVNESLNALIWTYCPKTSNSSRKIVQIAVNVAVSQFNYGKQATLRIMKELSIIPGVNAIAAAEEADKRRVKLANKRALNSTLEARIANRRKKKKEEEKHVLTEGDVYSPGAF